ncbi:MAG TPA: AAA family ATPase [Candidatus Scybalomonas excrementigallinarum]|nr:AAA family ATPase [Candidatus Scybalomonas excrementigallinarum]
MDYRLYIENFGKIKSANIQVKPLTLLVGDNNSGKSYLLSLIWKVQNLYLFDSFFLILKEKKSREYSLLYEKIFLTIKKAIDSEVTTFSVSTKELEKIWNYLFENGKEKLIRNLFNYNNMEIGKLELELEEKEIFITISKKIDRISINYMVENGRASEFSAHRERMEELERREEIIFLIINRLLLDVIRNGYDGEAIYLPAARTGFMLSKDIINQVARKSTFDLMIGNDEGAKVNLQPFPKPIIHFLDSLESLRIDNEIEYEGIAQIVQWIEEDMVKGRIQYRQLGNKEIQYVPYGKEQGIPLRTSSAVVTELTPLVLLLKYGKIRSLCYEEPEMCLHPQLQLEMGKLLIRLVNNDINIITTTHSDIILQHVNNMCRAFRLANADESGQVKEKLNQFELIKEDLIDISQVAVYQLTDHGSFSTVEEIKPEKDGFYVPTFSNALMNILEQTTEINDITDEE